jgi:hypothetical protein
MEAVCSSETLHLPISSHGTTTQKINFDKENYDSKEISNVIISVSYKIFYSVQCSISADDKLCLIAYSN